MKDRPSQPAQRNAAETKRTSAPAIADPAATLPRITKFTAGELLSDGSLIEVVRPADALDLQLLHWNGQGAKCAPFFVYKDFRYVPLEHPQSVCAKIKFPATALDYGSLRELVDELSSLIARVGRLASDDGERLALFVVATWFADVLPVAPFLWLVAPRVVPRERLVRLLTLLCRRSLLVTEFTLPTLQSAAASFRPTLIADVEGTSLALSRALRASSKPGILTVTKGGALDLCCAKILVSDEPFNRSKNPELPLEISLGPMAIFTSEIEAAEVEGTAMLLQQKLLMFRLVRHHDVASSNLDFGQFAYPIQTLLPTLAAPVWSDECWRSRIVSLFEGLDREIRAESAASIEALVIEALLAACHGRGREQATVQEITRSVNTLLEGREGGPELTPEKIGWRLRAIGIRRIWLPDGCRGVELNEKMRRRIHALAAQWNTRTWACACAKNKENCEHCAAQLQVVVAPEQRTGT